MIPKNCYLWQKQNITKDDIDLDIVKKYWDHSHSWRFLSKCKECGQLYIEDSIDFVEFDDDGREDEFFTLMVPVSEKELAENDFSKIPPKELFDYYPLLFWGADDRIKWIGESAIIPNLRQYKSVGQWYNHFKDNGYAISTALCNGLTKIMAKHDFSFAQAFIFLEEHGKIILAGRSFIYDLSGDEL